MISDLEEGKEIRNVKGHVTPPLGMGGPPQKACLTLAAHGGSPCSVYISIYSSWLKQLAKATAARTADEVHPTVLVFRVICCHKHLSQTGTLLWKPRINYRNTKMSAKKLWKTQLNTEGLNSHCRTGLTFPRACVCEALQHSKVSTTALTVLAVSDWQTGMRPAVGTPELRMLLCIISWDIEVANTFLLHLPHILFYSVILEEIRDELWGPMHRCISKKWDQARRALSPVTLVSVKVKI